MIKTGECGDFLESIIKVEPAEFQTIVIESVARSKANPGDNSRSSVKSASGQHSKRPFSKVVPKKHQTLAKSDISLPLRSVIKVEPEEFQKTATFNDFKPPVEDILDRTSSSRNLENEPTAAACSDSDKNSIKGETGFSLSVRGNEGLANDVPHSCFICRSIFANRGYLVKHIDIYHFNKAGVKFLMMKCWLCKKQFSIYKIHIHMKTHHVENCVTCKKVSEDSEEFKRHYLKNHFKGKVSECHCGKISVTRESARRHERAHDEIITCTICRKLYTSSGFDFHWKKSHLQTHGKFTTNLKIIRRKGPFICDSCGTKHPCRQSIIDHISICVPARTYCNLFPRSFDHDYFLVTRFQRKIKYPSLSKTRDLKDAWAFNCKTQRLTYCKKSNLK